MADDVLKREIISEFLSQIQEMSKALVGADASVMDNIEKELLLDKLCSSCKSSGEDLVVVQEFMKTDVYKTYVESIELMTAAAIKHLTMSVNKTVH